MKTTQILVIVGFTALGLWPFASLGASLLNDPNTAECLTQVGFDDNGELKETWAQPTSAEPCIKRENQATGQQAPEWRLATTRTNLIASRVLAWTAPTVATAAFFGAYVIARNGRKDIYDLVELETPFDPTPARVAIANLGLATVGGFAALIVHLDEAAYWFLRTTVGFQIWWNKGLDPFERKMYIGLGVLGLVIIASVIWFLYAVWYKGRYSDLYRRDPSGRLNGTPEPIGRYFFHRKYRTADGGAHRFRVFFKEGRRVFPLLRFEYVDVEREPERIGLSRILIECGRLERATGADVWLRKPTKDAKPARRFGDDFRETLTEFDHERKISIVQKGSLMNPDAARRKYTTDSVITIHDHRDFKLPASAKPGTNGTTQHEPATGASVQ